MANIVDISNDDGSKNFHEALQRSVQSAHINFLIGSGCSQPAISVLGNIESEIKELGEEEANSKLYAFIKPLLDSTDLLVETNLVNDGSVMSPHTYTLNTYSAFLKAIAHLIFERKGSLLPKQASIFTTNYDLFIEKSSDYADGTYYLNDGFVRNPSLTNDHVFSTSELFVSRRQRGYHYNYEVEIPSVNLLKLHGSLSWSKEGKGIRFSTETPERLPDTADSTLVKEFNESLSIILPNKEKFRDTLLNQTYYDLLRIYANELEKENTLLIAVGFSFADEHLLDITFRALRNPTLQLFVICFDKAEAARIKGLFSSFSNVKCVYNGDDELPFSTFVGILKSIHISHSESH